MRRLYDYLGTEAYMYLTETASQRILQYYCLQRIHRKVGSRRKSEDAHKYSH